MSKPSNQEEEYFARLELENKRRLARQQSEELAQREKDHRKELHFMKCPRCGMDLHTVKYEKLDVETCFHCHGVWLDAGELAQLQHPGRASPVMSSILSWFRND